MQQPDHKKAFKERVAKIKHAKGPVRDTAAGLIEDEPRAKPEPKSGTPTLLRLIALALAVTSLIITEAPEKFGVAFLFESSEPQPEAATSGPISSVLANNG